MNRRFAAVSFCLAAALSVGISGCTVNVDKGANGEDKKVQIDTPFGGVHVNTDQTTATDVGLPAYPGAELAAEEGHDKHSSANVELGFGEWKLKVRAISYATPDKKDKVLAFYKKALAKYGDVLTCQGNAPVGTPTVTAEGLTCADDGSNANVKINTSDTGIHKSDLQLKAGSKRHQHVVGFEDKKDGKTHFSMVMLDLPNIPDSKTGKVD